MYSFKDNVFRTLRRYNAGPLQDVFKISLWRAVLLAIRWSFGCELDGVHLRPLHLVTGKGHPRTFNADRSLYDFEPREGTDKPLHVSE